MTRSEAQKILIENFSIPQISGNSEEDTQFNIKMQTAFNMAIQALEQEPCEDEYIKVPKKALKYRTAGMVAYNAEWLKKHFDIERAVICGAQEPCEMTAEEYRQRMMQAFHNANTDELIALCVLPTEKEFEYLEWLLKNHYKQEPGYWIIKDGEEQGYDISGVKTWYVQIMCSKCGFIKTAIEGHTAQYNYCPNCGAKMIETQEGSGEE